MIVCKPINESCVNHLLSITCYSFHSFVEVMEANAMFLGIPKPNQWLMHESPFVKYYIFHFFVRGFLRLSTKSTDHYKLHQNNFWRKLLSPLTDFLRDRKQRVVLNDQISHEQISKQVFFIVLY